MHEVSARTATVGPHCEPGECTQFTGVSRPKERRATVPKIGGHQPHNWQAGVRFDLTIVSGTHVVAAPSCAGLAFTVFGGRAGWHVGTSPAFWHRRLAMGEVPRRSVGDGRLVGLFQVVVFLKGSWDWAEPLKDHSEGARGWLMDPLATCAGFSEWIEKRERLIESHSQSCHSSVCKTKTGRHRRWGWSWQLDSSATPDTSVRGNGGWTSR